MHNNKIIRIIIRPIIGIVVLTTLMGCESIHEKRKVYIRDRGQDYLISDLVAPLEVPEYLAYEPTDVFPLPETLPNKDGLEHVSVKPPGFGEMI